jgi:hypothetical protein
MKRSMTPSLQSNLFCDKKYHRKTFAKREKITKSMKMGISTAANGEAIKVTPKINVMLMKQLPIISPKANADWPLRKAFMSTENSGRLVPNAIIVAPMKAFDKPANSAITIVDSTRK